MKKWLSRWRQCLLRWLSAVVFTFTFMVSFPASASMCASGADGLPLSGVRLSGQQAPSGYGSRLEGYDLHVQDAGQVRSLTLRSQKGAESLLCKVSLQQPEVPMQDEQRGLLASFLLSPSPAHTLVLGLGNIELIKFLRSFTPAQFIDVVESDPAMITAASDYFDVKPDERLSVRKDQNMKFLLSRAFGSYDVIYLDQILLRENIFEHTLPDILQRQSILQEVRERLNEQGVMMVMLDGADSEKDIDRMIDVFPHVFVWEVPGSRRILVAALKRRQIVNPLIFRERARKLDMKVNAGFSFTAFIDRMLAGEYRLLEI